MKIAVTGAGGMLGRDVMRELISRGHNAVGLTRQELDITNELGTQRVLSAIRPDAVIHCAAYTAVDAAERDIDGCMEVNVGGTENIAEACRDLDAALIYVSTDYVFDGSGCRPWKADDGVGALNVYGASKLLGENAVIAAGGMVVRTSWLFGSSGRNFFSCMLELAKSGAPLKVVSDQIGRPTYTRDLAKLLCSMAERPAAGIYHASNSGPFASRLELASELFCAAGLTADIAPVSTADYPSAAKRPLNSRLDTSALSGAGYLQLRDWREALRSYLNETEAV